MATVKPRREPPPPNDLAESQPPSDVTDPALDPDAAHPAGQAKYGRFRAFIRALTFSIYFGCGCLIIHITQILGAPLYFVSSDLYRAYMSLTKASFGLLITTMTQWWAPTVIRISGDSSVAAQLRLTSDGRVECDFPERMVMIANHQIYTDWIYLWWVGYTNTPSMHGHIYILLKESLKRIPVIGPGCLFLGFIFLSRKMAVDKSRLARGLGKLKTRHTDLDGKSYLSPMWLLLFPEGTNLSANGRVKSASWAAKLGVRDAEHQMLPRSTGMFFCLNELKGTVDYVYDCTVAYEGVPRGKYGEQYFTLSSTYFQGRPPKSANFYWRRFKLDDMPLDDQEKFDEWLRERWYEKDALLEQYMSTGRFPANEAGVRGYIETEVRTQHWWEFSKIFVMLGTFGLILNVMLRTMRFLARA
ncbi:acyltransferase-domain-containing protein [Durotheca rogersii]|uniref:acyltransferase-domain-containing protein n=1 Tax=Durotheca rogersii TaxID=419775 RepID=UPI00222123E6|nr:acyltransferase-domain-containing protein [Durotheca rogersii]KAI5865237.1 acyltransferase-domain-containing protein [Durotheca rogersii]